MAPLQRPMYSPHNAKGPTVGKDVAIAKFAVGRYEDELLRPPAGGYTQTFGEGLYEALHKVVQPREGIKPTGDIGQATWDVLWVHLDDYHRWQYREWNPPLPPPPPSTPLPDLGPLYVGGASVLNHQLTHETDGIPNFPAYDDGWIAGRTVLAVENMTVDNPLTSSNPGEAFYAKGKSGIRYWYGHLTSSPPIGRQFAKGDPVGKILNWSRSHVHLGVDARALIGHSLRYGANGNGPDYTYGSATVGSQLKEALSLDS